MIPVATIFAIACPFLFFWRTATYSGSPAYGDASLGWPFIYSYAGLAGFRAGSFAIDFALGNFVGVLYVLFRNRNAINRNA